MELTAFKIRTELEGIQGKKRVHHSRLNVAGATSATPKDVLGRSRIKVNYDLEYDKGVREAGEVILK